MNNLDPFFTKNPNTITSQPEVTGALLSRMLTSMQDLGDAAKNILASKGVSNISLDSWYPRSIQHDCFNEVQRRFGESALYAIGFAYQIMVREKYSKEITEITNKLIEISQRKDTTEVVKETDLSIENLIGILHGGSVNNVRNHPKSYGFFSNKTNNLQYCISFSSFAIPSLTTYAEAIIYGMVRLAFPPQWDIKIDLDYKQKNRSDGHIADHFIVSMNFVSSNISIEEMRLLETLQVKQKLLLAAMTAAQAEHDKAAKLLANHIDSVTYASRLQKNLLVPNDLLDKRFSEFQAIWEPREIVGGDIYWTTPDQDPPLGHFSLALFDCTGHGVPGAMLSLLVTSAIDRIYANDPNVSPDAALISVDEALRSALHKRGSSSEIDDGCDAAIVRIYPDKRTIEYAGAKLGLIRVSKGNEHEIIQPVRVSLGYQDVPISVPKLNALSYESGDVFAMVTDGFTDQVGGPQPIARSYGYKRILESIANNSDKSVAEIIRILKEDFDHWQGNQLRRDDLTVLIFRP